MSGTAGAHAEDSTTSEDTTSPSGEVVSLGAHVSETNKATSRPSRTVEDILGAYPIDDTFWKNTNDTDVSIVTINSEEQMTGSHITEFHTPKDEEIVLDDLLGQVNQDFNNQHNQQLMAPKYDTDHENHNPSNPPSNSLVDCKLITPKNESIPSVAIQDQDYTDIIDELSTILGSDRNTVQRFINDMVGKIDVSTN